MGAKFILSSMRCTGAVTSGSTKTNNTEYKNFSLLDDYTKKVYHCVSFNDARGAHAYSLLDKILRPGGIYTAMGEILPKVEEYKDKDGNVQSYMTFILKVYDIESAIPEKERTKLKDARKDNSDEKHTTEPYTVTGFGR